MCLRLCYARVVIWPCMCFVCVLPALRLSSLCIGMRTLFCCVYGLGMHVVIVDIICVVSYWSC